MISYSSPSSTLKSRFTRRFLQALAKINNRQETTSPPHNLHRRYQRVRIAADKSLALAVGSRRSWSRALLCKIKNKKRGRCGLTRRRISSSSRTQREHQWLGLKGKSRALKKLVPGSEGMDFYSLLGETAHYMQCLTTQVQVMTCIANSCNST